MRQQQDEGAREARSLIPRIEALAALDPASLRIERLGGLTNQVFKVADSGHAYCLRIPGPGTEEYIDRANEAEAARQAAEAGVSPALVHVDPASGVLVTRYQDGALTMTPQAFRERAGAPARAARAFHALHTAGLRFPFRFELFAMIDEYLGVLAGKEVAFPTGYHDVLAAAGEVRSALQAHPLPLAACHCDPLCENFLDTGQRMWIVDWEYSGMNDPMWDLGDLSVEAGFDERQDDEMMTAYFGGEPPARDRARVIIYKAMCDLLWTLWGLIQHANGNPAEDFQAYARGRFERCKALMGAADFQRHLRAMRAG